MIQSLGAWLAASDSSAFVRGTRTSFPMFIPIMLVLHLVGIAMIVGAAALIGLRLLGLSGRSIAPSDIGRRMFPWIWTALPLMLGTGFTILCNRPARYLRNPIFELKMVLLVLAVLITFGLHRVMLSGDRSLGGSQAPLAGATLLAIWIATLFAGRWIPYA